MSDYLRPVEPSEAQWGLDEVLPAVLRHVYLLMFTGLALTAAVAYVTANTGLYQILASRFVLIGLVFVELVLVIGVSSAIQRISSGLALVLFFLYAAINGATLSVLFLRYTLESISLVFVGAACLFAVLSLVGFTTRWDLSRWGFILFNGLIALAIASVVNLLLADSLIQWMITYVGLVLFLGLTIYSTQWIKRQMADAIHQGDEGAVARVGILGALNLYLQFIYIFIRLLSIFGRRK